MAQGKMMMISDDINQSCDTMPCNQSCDTMPSDNNSCVIVNCDKIADDSSCADNLHASNDSYCDKNDHCETIYPIYANKNSPNKVKLASSYNPTEKAMNISAFRKKRGKYYLASKIASSTVILFCDSAADISITDYATSRLGTVEKLTTPIKIRSFDNNSVQEITEMSTLKLHFGSVIAIMKFYVCKTEFSIIGIDMLRNSKLNLSLNTKTEIFWIDRYPIKTSCSPEEAAKELSVRMNENKVRKERKIQARRQNWARSSHKQTARPYSLTDIEVTTDYKMDPTCKSVFLSLFDGDNEIEEVYIPSLMLHEPREKFYITVENKSDNSIVFAKGTAIGEVKRCSDRPGRHTVMSYDREEVQTMIRSMRNITCAEISTEQKSSFVSHYGKEEAEKANKCGGGNINFQNAITPQRHIVDKNQAPNGTQGDQTNNLQYSNMNFEQNVGNPQLCKLGENTKSAITLEGRSVEGKGKQKMDHKNMTDKVTSLDGDKMDFEKPKILKSSKTKYEDVITDGKPVNLSELVERDKVDNEKFTKCLKDGIAVDLDFDVPEPNIPVDGTPVDINAERRRSKGCKFWPDKEKYLEMFDVSTVDDELVPEVKALMYDFRHIMFNEDCPSQFHRGIEMPPIKVNIQKNAAPFPRIPPRRMSA